MEREVEMLRAHLESLATTNKYLLEERTKLLSLISSITLEKAQIQQENEQLRSELARKNQKLKVDPESHLFLNWYPNDPFTVDSYSRTFLSLVSMVRNGYRFEGRLPLRASTFLESLHHKIHQSINADYFMGIIGQGSRNPAAVSSVPNSQMPPILFIIEPTDPAFRQTHSQNPFSTMPEGSLIRYGQRHPEYSARGS
ncbi:hypothetical protein BLNAU_8885 [Blattamonas nauphoetae]|uniref:Uncharacterized protein n=1 Tax=Blattamonas nauphoetae TaxID=2049346 RepID=A0ABQ9XXC0_9EUKA|nr:hypothetical protein BLNAU_8885 [Blattamonas nauphoetae]